jgi:hypothetical protein
VSADQRWCLSCGHVLRTTLVAARGWRRPLLLTAAVATAAVIALVVAFALLTRNDNQVPAPQPVPAQTTPATSTVTP